MKLKAIFVFVALFLSSVEVYAEGNISVKIRFNDSGLESKMLTGSVIDGLVESGVKTKRIKNGYNIYVALTLAKFNKPINQSGYIVTVMPASIAIYVDKGNGNLYIDNVTDHAHYIGPAGGENRIISAVKGMLASFGRDVGGYIMKTPSLYN